MQTVNTDTNVQASGADEVKNPTWLVVTDEGATITLSTKKSFNGVVQDRITLTSPTVKLVRACQKQAGNDDSLLDDMLFSSLASVGLADIQSLTVKDYNRVQRGYFRMVEEDGI